MRYFIVITSKGKVEKPFYYLRGEVFNATWDPQFLNLPPKKNETDDSS